MNNQELNSVFGADNYSPLPVVNIVKGKWCTVWDTEGKEYLDMLAGYSANNFGHCNDKLVKVAERQLWNITLTSRAFNNNQLGPFCSKLAKLCNKEKVLPMNTGAEAVETAIKMARRWGYQVKGVAPDRADIIVCDNNFHGRTTTIISFSSSAGSTKDFGPFTPGFSSIPYGNATLLETMITDDTVAFLFEPVQGEAGVIVPPDGYLTKVRELCTKHNVLMIADEIQSGLGRTGHTFACEREQVVPDVYILGKALGGGIVPLSAVVANEDIMSVFDPGSHGSTFGGNPLACAIGSAVIDMITTGEYQVNARQMGNVMLAGLQGIKSDAIKEIRHVGLWFGVDIGGKLSGGDYCREMAIRGVLAKETHYNTLRFSPPLCISEGEVHMAIGKIARAFGDKRASSGMFL